MNFIYCKYFLRKKKVRKEKYIGEKECENREKSVIRIRCVDWYTRIRDR